jgi:L-lactate dehydrogenase complex protein LldG
MKQPSSRQIILERMERAYASRTITDDPKDGQAECLEEDLSQNKFFQDDILSLSEKDKMAYFCHMLESLKGECILCEDEQDMYEKMSNLMQKKSLSGLFTRDASIAEKLHQHKIPVDTDEENLKDLVAAVTRCEYLIVRTGSVLVSSASKAGRQLHVYPSIHIVIAHKNQLVDELHAALEGVRQKYKKSSFPSVVSVITGPSRTADIEKTLVLGAHGPKELIIFVQQK